MIELLKEQNELLKDLITHITSVVYSDDIRNIGMYYSSKKCKVCQNFGDKMQSLEKQIAEAKEPTLRDELIIFASRTDKYNLTNIRNVDVPSYLERLKKDHEIMVDDYLNSKQSK